MADNEDNEDNVDLYYDFRVPTASSIHPRLTREETLFALLEANDSRPIHKRFPVEILLLVNDELHPPNLVYEEIRSAWTVDTQFNHHDVTEDYLKELLFDPDAKTFYVSEQPFSERFRGRLRRRDEHDISDSFSAADFLYRMRCFFPTVPIDSEGPEGYKWVWTAAVLHKQTGIRFEFSERVGGAKVTATRREVDMYFDSPPLIIPTEEEDAKAFTTDALRLLNMLFGTVDGKRFIYYHPAADADYPTPLEHFLAVPSSRVKEDVENENQRIYKRWYPMMISAADSDYPSNLFFQT